MAKLYSNNTTRFARYARSLATAQLRHARMQHRQIKLYGMGLLQLSINLARTLLI